jgi:hypothetical protein
MTDLMVFDLTAEFRIDEHREIGSVVCLHVALSGIRAILKRCYSFIHAKRSPTTFSALRAGKI